MWEHWNRCLHSEASVANQRRSQRLNRRIHHQFSEGAAMLPKSALYLFQLPERKQLCTALEDRQRWLNLVKAERTLAIQQARALRTQRRQFTRHFSAE